MATGQYPKRRETDTEAAARAHSIATNNRKMGFDEHGNKRNTEKELTKLTDNILEGIFTKERS